MNLAARPGGRAAATEGGEVMKKHLALLLSFGVLENFGYRQLTVLWRIKAFWDYMRGKKGWGTMTRTGFGTKPGS